jgi:hypothetical protein
MLKTYQNGKGLRMKNPTAKQLWEEELEQVLSEVVDHWRHGTVEHEVFYREEDDTHWEVYYRRQTDGEYDELRDEQDSVKVTQVKPITVEVVKYILV